ncbi:MAG: type II toxin-antitoxin system PemK/MazF family toxin [Micropruina sp.]
MKLPQGLLKLLVRTLDRVLTPAAPPRTPAPTRRPPAAPPVPGGEGYPGDFLGEPTLEYAPHEGRLPDPGEVVWTWVPYEEDHTRGKDRPVLIIGRDGRWLLGLGLTSQDHDRDAAQEAEEGRFWVDIGSWDDSGRVSEVRVNRILRVDPDRVRRVAAHLDRQRFDRVAAGVRRYLHDR